MGSSQLIRFAVVGGVLIVAVSTISAAPARELAPPNAAAKYAIDVPGSVLADAAPAGHSGAALAAGQRFDWAAAEAQFAAPATRAVTLTKVVAGTNIAVLGFSSGTMIGQGASRVFGFTDDTVCEQHNAALTVFASVLDGVNCDAWGNTIAEVQRDADEVPVSSFDPVSVGGVTVEYVNGIPWPQLVPGNLLTCFRYAGALPTTARYVISVKVWGANGTINSSGFPDTSNSYCGPMETSNLSGWWIGAPLLRYQVTIWDWDGVAPTYTSPVMTGTVTQPHPERHLECSILTTESHLYTATSAAFHETDASLPAITCPVIPANEIAAHQSISETGGTTEHALQSSDTTKAYRDWRTAHPNCNDGTCQLDLQHDDTSCFREVDPTSCDGWLDHPADYRCSYGGTTVDLSECNIYGTVFSPVHQADGTAYADPVNGAPVLTPTSPTATDLLTATLLDRHWDEWKTAYYELGTGDEGSAARAVAAQCIALGVADECATTPIFSPGSDILEAAQHDLDAIQGKGSTATRQPALLEYASELDRLGDGVRRNWYEGKQPCNQPRAIANLHCDEYPFFSSTSSGPGSSLRLLSKKDNFNEGQYLKHFYASCRLTSPGKSAKYLVVPLVTAPTSEWCEK